MSLKGQASTVALALLPWLLAFVHPEIRTQLRLQIDGFWSNNFPYTFYSDRNVDWNAPWYRLRPTPLAELQKEHPRDVRIAFAVAEKEMWNAPQVPTKHGEQRYNYNRVRPFDELIRRFPQHSWPVASRIRVTTSASIKDDRLGGSFEDHSFPPVSPPPTKAKAPPSFTPAELQRCVEVARHGRAAEPQNSFYDWWLAYFLYAGYRDQEAFAVLHQGAGKKYYDDHTREEIQARIAVQAMRGPVTAEDKASYFASQIYPHFSFTTHFARLLAWHSRKEMARGRRKQALQIVVDVTRIGRQMRDHGYVYLDSMVGDGNTLIAWSGVTRDFSSKERELQRTGKSGSAAALAANVARRAGDPATATLILRESRLMDRRSLQWTAWDARNPYIGGLRKSLIRTPATLWMASEVLLYQDVILVFASVILIGISWPFRKEPVHVQPRDNKRTVAACWFLFACTLICIYRISQELTYFSGDTEDNPVFGYMAMAGFWAPLALPLIIAAAVTRWRRPRQPRMRPAEHTGLAAIQAWLTALAQTLRHQLNIRPPSLAPGRLFSIHRFTRPIGAMGLWIPLIVTSVAITVTIAMAYFPSTDWWTADAAEAMPGFIIGGFVFFCLVSLFRARWHPSIKPRRIEVNTTLRWYRKSLLAYLQLTGWVYLALSIAALGPRRASSTEVDNYIQRGERATMLLSQFTRPSSP